MREEIASKTNESQNQKASVANAECYGSYYSKPRWWFRLRYDTQIKRKTVLHLIKDAGKQMSNQSVLEIGFGSGAVLFSFDSSCHIHGVEISESALNNATKIAEKKGYEKFSFSTPERTLPVENETMDIVIASHVLEHVADDVALLQEIKRVLKPDGIAVIVVPINERYDDPNHVRHYSTSSIVQLVRGLGFTVRNVLENELLFHIVEKFYFEGYNTRWRILGPLIAAVFNVPLALMPFRGYQLADRFMATMGFQPRQVSIVLHKSQPTYKMF